MKGIVWVATFALPNFLTLLTFCRITGFDMRPTLLPVPTFPLFLLIALAFSGPLSAQQSPPASKGIRILFLGDQGHHRPSDRFKQLEPALTQAHIRYTYTESLEDLNPDKLAGYDCIVIYANHTKISPEQEKSLMDFVNNGGGLVALHCASYCFLNSTNYLELVGARFKSHKTGDFEETVLTSDHPVLQGVGPIKSWDETYVHEKHNTNRIVLAERVEGELHEPYTWVRTSGKGRVFYTAWGHDQRTWSNTNFVHMVINAIEWTSMPSAGRLTPHAGLPPFRYTNSPALPNYLAGARWGTQGDPIRTMQEPLSPEESMKHLVLLPGFQAKLFAAEPEVTKPICMQWDARGRLWIAETVDYPNQMQPMGQGHDRIRICEDTDGDGRADKFTIFADKLSIPSGFVFYKNGIIVVHSGLTEFLQDTNGNSKADKRTILFTGWGTQDTHAGPSNLRYGFDNWIWGTVGYSGFEGVVGGKRMRFGQGIYRFKPDGSALEFVRSSNNNTWGLGISENNIIFGSTANNNASMYMPIPNRYYEAVRGWSASRLETAADSQEFFPITDKVRQVDWHGHYTAGAGGAIYTARQFPKEYWNRVQFVAEPTGHLLGKFHLHPNGADFTACNGRNFLASDDEWTSPVAAEVGPDGALWVIDWYNYIIQHNPVPIGFQKGKGNAYETPMRDKIHGRIYRVEYSGGAKSPKLDLEKASSKELVQALNTDNLFWRLTAQRLLVERGDTSVVPDLCELVSDQKVDEIGLNVGAIHALWTLEGLHQFGNPSDRVNGALMAGLRHPSIAVKRAAIMVAPRDPNLFSRLQQSHLIGDVEPQLGLTVLLAISESPVQTVTGHALAEMVRWSAPIWDRWLREAGTCAVARNDFSFLTAILSDTTTKAEQNATEAVSEIVRRVAAHYALGAPTESVAALLSRITPQTRNVALGPFLEGLSSAWPAGESPTLTDSNQKRLQELMVSLDHDNQARLLVLAQKWRRADLFPNGTSVLTESLISTLKDSSAEISRRSAAATKLITLRDRPETVQIILEQINELSPPDLSSELIDALSKSRDPQTGAALVQHLPKLTPAARRYEIASLVRRKEWSTALLDSIEAGKLPPSELATEQWAELRNNPDSKISKRAQSLAGNRGAVTADRAAIVEKLLPAAGKPGDPHRGKEVFDANCAVCHAFNGTGGKVGPNLTGIGSREPKEILIDILDPNRSVEANYRSWIVSTGDETFAGRLDSETQTTVEILDSTGQKHVIQRKDIKQMNTSGTSIMPNGFESLPESDLSALLAYLATPATAAAVTPQASESARK
jgi:putative membrane-bound dehydrogenase-like protein